MSALKTRTSENLQSATRAVRAGLEADSQYGAVMPPIVLSSTFAFEGFEKPRAYDYSRSGNPTRDQFGVALADLEGGAGAVVTSTGLSAIALVLHLLEPGQRVLAPHDGYGGTFRLLRGYAAKGWIDVRFVDYRDEAALAQELAQKPRLVWIETPSNPLLRITDIAAVASAAHEVGALVAVDNTFLSPVLQSPLDLGADLVVHSTTKYLNGHSDVVGGAVIAKDVALHRDLAWWGNAVGLVGSPFDSYLALRGLRTLHARIRSHEENAAEIAEFLAHHPAVARVFYPGLAEHPGHALARRQQSGFGGMVSFELAGFEGEEKRGVAAFLDGLRCFTLAESLGGVESLVAHPATMTHASMTPEARAIAGLGDGLLRMSVGVEDVRDLVRDLNLGLARALAVADQRAPHDRHGLVTAEVGAA